MNSLKTVSDLLEIFIKFSRYAYLFIKTRKLTNIFYFIDTLKLTEVTSIEYRKLRGRIHGEISVRAEISARLLGDGKEGGNVLNKKHEVWNTESAL